MKKMGKGARKRLLHQENLISKEEKVQKEMAEKRKNKIVYFSIFFFILIVIVGIVATRLVSKHISESGSALRKQVIMNTEHYTIDGAMMTYYIHSEINNFQKEDQGKTLDLSKDLKEEKCSLPDVKDQTWYEYFADKAKTKASRDLVFAEAAYDVKFELDEKGKEEVEEQLSSLEEEAKNKNEDLKAYIVSNFGQGVQMDDIRKVVSLQELGYKYKEEYKQNLTFTDVEKENFLKNNSKYYNTCDYYTITFVSSVEDGMTQEQIDSYNKSSLIWAEGLADCHSVASFESYLYGYFTKYYEERSQEYTDETIRNEIDKTAVIVKDFEYNDSELADWALDSSRKVGDTKIINGDNQYEVYMIVTAPHKSSYTTKNVRAIWLSSDTYTNITNANSQARKILVEWKKNPTEENFKKLAEKYSDDKYAASKGGLMENCLKDQIDESLSKWIYDSSREYADYSIIKQNEEGYYIAFYVGDGIESWKAVADHYIRDDEINQQFEIWQKEFHVKTNAVKLDKLKI